jgi:cephalosporin hydroxylase
MMEPVSADFEFCPALAEMMRTRRVTGNSGKVFDGLAALSTGSNLLTLRRLMLNLRPKRTLEIGLSFGGSALMLAQHIATWDGHPPDSTWLWIRFKRVFGI